MEGNANGIPEVRMQDNIPRYDDGDDPQDDRERYAACGRNFDVEDQEDDDV